MFTRRKPMLESDLEKALIEHIEDFLLELGRGFMFVGLQQRISIAGMNYYVDMVFYNKILRAYVLIDLKINKLKPENFGQMNMYIYYIKDNKLINQVSKIQYDLDTFCILSWHLVIVKLDTWAFYIKNVSKNDSVDYRCKIAYK